MLLVGVWPHLSSGVLCVARHGISGLFLKCECRRAQLAYCQDRSRPLILGIVNHKAQERLVFGDRLR
jgi:hypothetical protein